MDESAAVPEPSPTTEFNLLGPLAVLVDGSEVRLGGRRQVAVLGRLVLSPGLVVSMDELADSVWDGDSPSRPDVAIRSYVSNLRRSIEPGRHRGDRRSYIESLSPGYRLVVERQQLDSHRFESLLTAGRTALGDDDPGLAVRSLETAQRLWRGEPCEGLIETDALLAFRSRMAELRLATTELRCEATLALGEHESVIADLEAAMAAHPLRERLTELAMLALYRAGRQSDALSACRQLHDRLLDKLGVTPGRPIQELEHRILTHDPTLSAPARSPSANLVVPSSRPEIRRSIVEPSQRHTGPGLRSGPGIDLAGRDLELRSLDVVAQRLHGGLGVTVLVTGEHGIGKTSLIERYCSEIDGAPAVWGRCRSMASENPLWPWIQILDDLAPLVDNDETATSHAAALDIASGLPPTTGRGAGHDHSDSPDDDTGAVTTQADVTSVFRPIVEVLRGLAASGPLIIVIDDAQWADAASLELLSFAATTLANRPVAFIVSWQESSPTAATSSLRALARTPQATRIEVGPLSRAAVDRLVEASGLGGRTLARRIWAETVGHPQFVQELLGTMERSQEVSAFGLSEPEPRALLPTANLRDSVMTRIESAHPAAEAIINVAAMHRGGFSIEVLTECVDSTPADVEDALEALVDSGLVTEQGAGATFRFVHPIAAKAICSAISGSRQARLHATIGHAMWRHGWPNTELAYHFSRAGSTGTSLLAARFAVEATREAVALNEIDQIEDVVVQGLAALEQLGNSDPLEVELASFLAQVARLRGASQQLGTMGRRAIDAARRLGDEDVLVEATLAATGPSAGLPSFSWAGWVGMDLDRDPARLHAIQSGLEQTDAGVGLRTMLESRSKRGGADQIEPPGDPVPASADEGGDPLDGDASKRASLARPSLLSAAEQARNLLYYGAGTDWDLLADRLSCELADHADGAGHKRLLVDRLRFQASLDSGDRVALDRALAGAGSTLIEPDRSRPWTTIDLDRLHLRTAADLVLGRLGSAERSLEIARSRCHRTGADATAFDRQLISLRWEQGKYDELDELVLRAGPRAGQPWDIRSIVVSALSATGRGDLAAAREHLEQLVSSTAWPEAIARRHPPSLLCVAANVANAVGDRAVAKVALKGLLALRGSTVSAGRGGVMLGSASYYAGLAAATVGKRKQARELLQRSTDHARSLGAATWLCRSLVAQAEAVAVEDAPASTIESWQTEAAGIAADIGAGWFDIRPGRR